MCNDTSLTKRMEIQHEIDEKGKKWETWKFSTDALLKDPSIKIQMIERLDQEELRLKNEQKRQEFIHTALKNLNTMPSRKLRTDKEKILARHCTCEDCMDCGFCSNVVNHLTPKKFIDPFLLEQDALKALIKATDLMTSCHVVLCHYCEYEIVMNLSPSDTTFCTACKSTTSLACAYNFSHDLLSRHYPVCEQHMIPSMEKRTCEFKTTLTPSSWSTPQCLIQ